MRRLGEVLLRLFSIFCSDKLKIQTRFNWVWIFYLVEVRGIEPLSKEVIHGWVKAFPAHVHRIIDALT